MVLTSRFAKAPNLSTRHDQLRRILFLVREGAEQQSPLVGCKTDSPTRLLSRREFHRKKGGKEAPGSGFGRVLRRWPMPPRLKDLLCCASIRSVAAGRGVETTKVCGCSQLLRTTRTRQSKSDSTIIVGYPLEYQYCFQRTPHEKRSAPLKMVAT